MRRVEQHVDQRLAEFNCEYEDRLQSRRMAPVVLKRIPEGTWAEHRTQMTSHEGSDTYAYKHPFLAAKTELAEKFRAIAGVGG